MYIPTPVNIMMAAIQSEIVRSIRFNGSGCSNRNSHKDFGLCNTKEIRNSSTPLFDLLLRDSITYNDLKPIAEGISSTCLPYVDFS